MAQVGSYIYERRERRDTGDGLAGLDLMIQLLSVGTSDTGGVSIGVSDLLPEELIHKCLHLLRILLGLGSVLLTLV